MLQCVYTICRANPNVILLRLDFDEFDIAQPFTCGSSSSSVACTTTDGPLIGRSQLNVSHRNILQFCNGRFNNRFISIVTDRTLDCPG